MYFRNSGVKRSNMKLLFAYLVIWPWRRHLASIVFLPCSFHQASEESIHSEDAPSWSPCVLPVVHGETTGSQFTLFKGPSEPQMPVSTNCQRCVWSFCKSRPDKLSDDCSPRWLWAISAWVTPHNNHSIEPI